MTPQDDQDGEDDRVVEELTDVLGLRSAPWTARPGAGPARVPAPRAGGPGSDGKEAAVALVAALRRRHDRAAAGAVGALPGLAAAIHRLRVLGRPDEMLRDACREAAGVTGLERVTISAVQAEEGIHRLHSAGTPLGAGGHRAATTDSAVPIRPGSPEAAAVARRTPAIAPAPGGSSHEGAYAVVPILRSDTVVGLFHAAHEPFRTVAGHRVAGLAAFASAFAPVWHGSAVQARWEERAAALSDAVATTVQALVERTDEPALDVDVESPGAPGSTPTAANTPLTPRERVVLEHVLSGSANREIAEALVLTVETVKTHVKNILRKQGAANRAELISRNYRRMAP